jgi:hypothetical protein
VGDLAGVPLWGRMFCRSERVLQTSCCECDSHRLHQITSIRASRSPVMVNSPTELGQSVTKYPVAQQNQSASLRRKRPRVILAGITILWMVNRTTAPNLS